MSYPVQRPLYDRVYAVYAKSLAAADSPAFAAAARGAVIRVNFVPLVAPATSATNITPQVNATAMQLNGANVDYQIPSGATADVAVGPQDINGLNLVNEGDVISLLSDAGAANASSVPGYYTVVVREASAAA
jgi:hypothetical protein